MYWGKSLDQCTDRFCSTSIGLSMPFMGFNQNASLKTSLKFSRPEDNVKSDQSKSKLLTEKRSLRKYQNELKTPVSSSTNATSGLCDQTKKLKEFQSPNKTSIKKCPYKEIDFSKQNRKFKDAEQRAYLRQGAYKDQTYNQQANSYINLPLKQQSKKDLNIAFTPSQAHYTSHQFQPNTHTQGYPLPNYQQNQTNRNNCQNLRIEESGRNPNGNEGFRKLVCFSPTHRIIQNTTNSYQVKWNVKSNTNNEEENRQKHSFVVVKNEVVCKQNQVYSPVRQIQRLVIDEHYKLLQAQFPTIRQENETYQQSKSFTDHSKQVNQKAFNQFELKAQQIPVLHSINNSLQSRPQEHDETFYQVIPNIEPEFRHQSDQNSGIEGMNHEQNFTLSCEQLMLQSEKINTDLKEHNYQEEKLFERINLQNEVQRLSVQRRQLHQPSICIKLIENKLRGHAYQMSRSSSGEEITSRYKSSNPPSEPHEDFQSRQPITPREETQKQSSFKCSNFQKQRKNKVNFDLQEPLNLLSQNTDRFSENSLIHGLEEEKQNHKQNKNEFLSFKKPLNGQNYCKVIQQNLFKEVGNVSNLHSERQFSCSIRRICSDDKKFKTLVNKKATMNSISQEDSSIARKQQSNTVMSKYVSEQNVEGMLASGQNIDRDQSTVIGRYTFHRTLAKLL